MFKRLFSKDAENFAVDLALEFARRFPADPAANAQASGLARAVDDVCARAAEFQRAHRLGVLGKARLGTAFKLQLKESGYPEDFVAELTQRVLISLSAPPREEKR